MLLQQAEWGTNDLIGGRFDVGTKLSYFVIFFFQYLSKVRKAVP